jgi:cytochrome c biogenesis protein CcmG, thiol:disulfide interchange protein DsbE
MTKRRTLALAVAVAAVVALVAVIAAQTQSHRTRSAHAAGISINPTSWALPALNGDGTVALDQFRGRPTVVNFFASWCDACDFELPGFATISRQLDGRVHFVGVNALETGDPNYMPTQHHITWWPLARDVGGAHDSGLHDALGGGNSMPVTAFYDARGHLVEVERAALPEPALRADLQHLLGIAPGG